MPDLTLSGRVKRQWLIEERWDCGTFFLDEKSPQKVGEEFESVKTGDVNTILAELARRMRDGTPS